MLAGNSADWLAHFRTLEERLIEAVETVWPICIAPLQAVKGSMTHEDYITNHLVAALIRNKRLPGRIVPQYPLLSPNAQQLLKVGSKIDFVLTIGDQEDVYLACECKRLNVPYKKKTRALAYEYVRDGLMRFVSGQYSRGLPLAMMLGYVMDQRADIAHQRVKRAIGRSKSIQMKSSVDEVVGAGKPIRFSTIHICASGQDIQVRHTLLAWP
jgi:hypothetical protein